jgi:RNA polymerase-interacting CarD/CdnL/TRCF family regulator
LSDWRFCFFSTIEYKEMLMSFCEGDSVMHWTFGLGKVVRLEARNMSGSEVLYYAIQINDMTIWVPEDEMLSSRLRPPSSANEFKKLLGILSKPGAPLPEDRHQRKLILTEMLKGGSAESVCRVIRSLIAHRKVRALNENDQALLKRLEKTLIGEWSVSLTVTPLQAETELRDLLSQD